MRQSTSPQDALKAAKQLVGCFPHARPPEPETYAAALAAVLAQYPLGLVQECCDPRTGLARSREFPPTVACIVEWCDKRLQFHTTVASYKPKAQKPPEPEFSDEHRLNMLQRLSKLMHDLMDKRPVMPAPTDDEIRAHYATQRAAE